jgi:DNA-binding MarR family transcriptional regulator
MLIELQRGLNLTKVLRSQHSDFPPNGLAIFLSIANKEGMSSTELVELLDMPKATVSRNLRMLGDILSPNKEGMKLVKLIHDPMDYRVRRGYLTATGRVFLAKIRKALA